MEACWPSGVDPAGAGVKPGLAQIASSPSLLKEPLDDLARQLARAEPLAVQPRLACAINCNWNVSGVRR